VSWLRPAARPWHSHPRSPSDRTTVFPCMRCVDGKLLTFPSRCSPDASASSLDPANRRSAQPSPLHPVDVGGRGQGPGPHRAAPGGMPTLSFAPEQVRPVSGSSPVGSGWRLRPREPGRAGPKVAAGPQLGSFLPARRPSCFAPVLFPARGRRPALAFAGRFPQVTFCLVVLPAGIRCRR
jgi:hypothetical protein